MTSSEDDKIKCPDCGYIMGKNTYESRHKDSKKCQHYQRMSLGQ